jgi:hypothetical protein
MIIGLAGYARAGKDTVAQILVEERGFRRIAFADALRDMLAALDPYIGTTRLSDRLNWHGWEATKADPEVRRLLQRLGTEAGRDVLGPDVWVDAAVRKMDLESEENYVVSDVRFPNELQAIRSYGQVWRIERPGCEPVNGHVSETALDGARFDRVISNNGSIDDLAERVLRLVDAPIVPVAV